MKEFRRNIFSFLLICLFSFLVFFITSSFFAYKSIRFKTNSNDRFVVIGHSHPECAYNDLIIQDMVNLAQSREPYFYSYLKIRKVLEQNQNIQTVFVEYTNNNISSIMDDWLFGDSDVEHKFVRYASFMSLREMSIVLQGNPREVINRLPSVLKRNVTFTLKGAKNFLYDFGSFLELEHVLEPSHLVVEDSAKLLELSHTSEVSENNIYYLRKIIDLCKDRDVEIVLIRTPFHPVYLLDNDQNLYSYYLKNHFKDVKYLDFSGFQLDLGDLADTQHLNKWGAQRYSKWFNRFLKLGKLNQPTIDSLILIENKRLRALENTLE